MYNIEVVMLFLILASETTIDKDRSEEASVIALSRFLI